MTLKLAPLRLVSSVLLLQSRGRTRDMHAIVLMTHGYDVDCTSNAIQGWKMWEAKRPDLVLFALEIYDPQLFRLIEGIRRSDLSQPIGMLRPRLCSVSLNGNLVRRAMEPDNILDVVEANSAGAAHSGVAAVQPGLRRDNP